jgi:hypothetical protein
MALGQLADYKRVVPTDPRLALLVAEEPRSDLRALLESQDVGLIGGLRTDTQIAPAEHLSRGTSAQRSGSTT